MEIVVSRTGAHRIGEEKGREERRISEKRATGVGGGVGKKGEKNGKGSARKKERGEKKKKRKEKKSGREDFMQPHAFMISGSRTRIPDQVERNRAWRGGEGKVGLWMGMKSVNSHAYAREEKEGETGM